MTFPTLLSTLLSVALVLIALPTSLHAAEPDRIGAETERQIGSSAIVTVLSVTPSTEIVTNLEASGQWRNSCIPELDAVEVTSSETGNGLLMIEATAEPAEFVCAQSVTDWHFPIDVQFDVPGTYTVQLSITSQQLDSTELFTSNEIVVIDESEVASQASPADQPVLRTNQTVETVIYLPNIVQSN